MSVVAISENTAGILLRQKKASSLSGNFFRGPRLVRRAQVREFREQVFVRPDLIFRHLSIGKDRKKEIHNIVGQRPAIRRVDRGLGRVIRKNVRQQSPGNPGCFR